MSGLQGLMMRYFVLNPNSSDIAFAIASRQAMEMFAQSIESTNPKLASDLREWIKQYGE